jgi:hypothetical protein
MRIVRVCRCAISGFPTTREGAEQKPAHAYSHACQNAKTWGKSDPMEKAVLLAERQI